MRCISVGSRNNHSLALRLKKVELQSEPDAAWAVDGHNVGHDDREISEQAIKERKCCGYR